MITTNSNQQGTLYTVENLIDIIQKMQDHISRMNNINLTKIILMYIKTQKNNRWINDIRKNMQGLNITDEGIQDRNTFRDKTKNFNGFQVLTKKINNNLACLRREKTVLLKKK